MNFGKIDISILHFVKSKASGQLGEDTGSGILQGGQEGFLDTELKSSHPLHFRKLY